jgi:hypothetical protein
MRKKLVISQFTLMRSNFNINENESNQGVQILSCINNIIVEIKANRRVERDMLDF